jgi:predicted negative regulator of RcsB-dependent stress response
MKQKAFHPGYKSDLIHLLKGEGRHLTEYLTEQEQIEILKSWIKQYSLVILAGVILAGFAIFGWRYWQERQYKVLSHASSVYDEMLTVRAQNNQEATLIQAKKLFAHYSQTSYGQMAAFMLARHAIVNKDYPEAEKQLQWVIGHSKIPAMRQIARIRLARLLIAESKPKDSIQLLNKIDDKTFVGLIDEVRGDAFLAMNDKTQARAAYQSALAGLPNAEVVRPLLQMKYDNLS